LANWLNYVGYLAKQDFFAVLDAIGAEYNFDLFDRLFWLFDLNNDGVIDEKEFLRIS
jgi:Ca2+-binding EF-hand superfamily protein